MATNNITKNHARPANSEKFEYENYVPEKVTFLTSSPQRNVIIPATLRFILNLIKTGQCINPKVNFNLK